MISMEHVEFLLENYTKRQLAEQIILYAQDLEIRELEEQE